MIKALEYVGSYIIVIVSVMTYVFAYQKISDLKLNITVPKILLVLIVAIITMLNNIYNLYFYKLIVGFLMVYLTCRLWFKNKPKPTFYYSVIIVFFEIIAELLLCILYQIWFGSLDALNSSYVAKSSLTIIMSITTYFILCIPALKRVINKLGAVLISKISNEIIMFIVIIVINLLSMQIGLDYRNNLVYIISIVVITVVSALIFIILKNNYAKEKLKIKSDFLYENVKNYENIVDDYRELRHNLNYDFLAIRSVANKQTQQLIDEKIKKYHNNYDWISDIGKIPKGLQGVLYIKLYEIKNKNLYVELNTNLNKNVSTTLPVKKYSILCDALGITIDNAIEAAQNSNEKSIYINIVEDNNSIKIRIMNTFKNLIDVDKIGKKNYSTKVIKSGIGLNYINNLSKKSINIKKEIINNVFIVSLDMQLS